LGRSFRGLVCRKKLPISHKIFPSPNRKNLADDPFWSVKMVLSLYKWSITSILSVESLRRKWPSACTQKAEVSSFGLSPEGFKVLWD
jgi:hypothetical protein